MEWQYLDSIQQNGSSLQSVPSWQGEEDTSYSNSQTCITLSTNLNQSVYKYMCGSYCAVIIVSSVTCSCCNDTFTNVFPSPVSIMTCILPTGG